LLPRAPHLIVVQVEEGVGCVSTGAIGSALGAAGAVIGAAGTVMGTAGRITGWVGAGADWAPPDIESTRPPEAAAMTEARASGLADRRLGARWRPGMVADMAVALSNAYGVS
jgi:hypothetical protein